MALTGTFNRTLDSKHRLAVPRTIREAFGEDTESNSLYVAPGTEQCLLMYSAKGFQTLAERFALQSQNEPQIRNYLRLFFARAEEVQPDSQGRIRLPDRLVRLGGLQHEVTVLGVQDHAEIWDSTRWEQFLAVHEASFDELAGRALDWSG